jgi:hypothetical protein
MKVSFLSAVFAGVASAACLVFSTFVPAQIVSVLLAATIAIVVFRIANAAWRRFLPPGKAFCLEDEYELDFWPVTEFSRRDYRE